jgi:hypothetical protein
MLGGAVGAAGAPKWVRLGSSVARQVGEVGEEAKLLEQAKPLAVGLRGAKLVARRDWRRGLALGEADLGGLTTRSS